MIGRLRLHDRLIARAVLGALLPVWLILVGLDGITALVGELDEINSGYGAGTALLYTLNTIPRRAYELFPTAAVIGTLMGLGELAVTSELTALRAGGLARSRIALGTLSALLVLTALMVLTAETIGPAGERRAQMLALAAKSNDLAITRGSGLWAREGDLVLNAKHSGFKRKGNLDLIELRDVTLYTFDPNGRLAGITRAVRAEYQEGAWHLFQVRRALFESRRVQTEARAEEIWRSGLNPRVLSLGLMRPRYLPTRELGVSLEYLDRNALDPGEFELAYWSRWFYPINVLALCLAAIPFAFGTLRSGGFGKRLFLGIVFGLGYFLLQRLAINLAQVYHIDLRLANAVPPATVLALSWLMFRKRF